MEKHAVVVAVKSVKTIAIKTIGGQPWKKKE